MEYKVIGLMSGSSLDGIDIVYVTINEKAGQYDFKIICYECVPYQHNMQQKLQTAEHLSITDFLKLHSDYGQYLGKEINNFIKKNDLEFKVDFIVSHGHTIFHQPSLGYTTQIGCGAHIAAITQISVIDNLRTMDVAYGGQGAPIVAIGDKYFFRNYHFLLNIGGICNLTFQTQNSSIAFDIAPANSILNFLSKRLGKAFDDEGNFGRMGVVDKKLINAIESNIFFQRPAPKSLSNQFGINEILPLLQTSSLSNYDLLATYYDFLSTQIAKNIVQLKQQYTIDYPKLLITGGGAYNKFLIEHIRKKTYVQAIKIEVPNDAIIKFKEALTMALIGVLRWRLEPNVLKDVTGAYQDNVNGAIWFANKII